MEHTSSRLRHEIDAGELQCLAFDMFTRMEPDWRLVHSGIVEGTAKTRKGTPDIWGFNSEGRLVYIQATVDPAKGKMLEDIEKSVKKLIEEKKVKGALCVAFTSFDPHHDQFNKCEEYCRKNGCEFLLVNNAQIASFLNKRENHDLRKKYLKIPMEDDPKGIVEQLHMAVRDVDILSIKKNLESIKRMTDANDDVRISLDYDNPNIIRVSPKIEGGGEVARVKMTFIIPEEFRHCETFPEMVSYSYHKQIPITAIVVKKQTYIGDHLIESFVQDENGQQPLCQCELVTEAGMEIRTLPNDTEGHNPGEITIYPPPFPDPTRVIVESEGNPLLFTSWGLEEIDEGEKNVRLVFSNKSDVEIPIYVKLWVEFPKVSEISNGSIIPLDNNITIESEENVKAYHRYLKSKMSLQLFSGGGITIRSASDGQILFSGDSTVRNETEMVFWERAKSFWWDVLRLEKFFKVVFDVHSGDEQDWNLVYTLLKIIEEGKLVQKVPEGKKYNVPFDTTEKLSEIIELNQASDGFFSPQLSTDATIEVLGVTINLGDRIDISPKLKMIDVERAKRKLEDLVEGEIVNIEFEALSGTTLHIFPKFYGTDDIEEIARREGLE